MINTAVLEPAYNARYYDQDEVIGAFFAGHDFKQFRGRGTYTSIRNFEDGDIVELRYGDKLEHATVYIVGGE